MYRTLFFATVTGSIIGGTAYYFENVGTQVAHEPRIHPAYLIVPGLIIGGNTGFIFGLAYGFVGELTGRRN